MKTMKLFSVSLCALAFGCSTGAAGTDETPGGSVNVAQGGAQDFAQFRALVQAGKVPTPDTLDSVGFFAEHALDMPEADCGKDVCVHPFLAVAPRFNGGNWTMAYVTMNTAVDPKDLPHPPVHLVIAVERSAYTGLGQASIASGASELLAGLTPQDRVSVVSFAATAEQRALALSPSAAELPGIVGEAGMNAFGDDGVGLYEGIAAAEDALEKGDAAGFSGQHRILLLTSGHATKGITDPAHILSLGEGIAAQGTAFSVIGLGADFAQQIPTALGSMGAGTYAYALSTTDLNTILSDEGQTSFFPLATEFTLEVVPAKGYEVGRVYGVHRAVREESGVTLSMPALFIGQRAGSSDVGGSRRGGGGGLFVELNAESAAASIGAGAEAFAVTADWKQASGGAAQGVQTAIANSLPPGTNPPDIWWTITDGAGNQDTHGKPFMMLNMYLAFRGVIDFYQAGDCERALGVVDMMQLSVSGWLGKYQDTDITDDNNLMLMLRANVEQACQAAQSSVTPVEPTGFGGGCCMF